MIHSFQFRFSRLFIRGMDLFFSLAIHTNCIGIEHARYTTLQLIPTTITVCFVNKIHRLITSPVSITLSVFVTLLNIFLFPMSKYKKSTCKSVPHSNPIKTILSFFFNSRQPPKKGQRGTRGTFLTFLYNLTSNFYSIWKGVPDC